MHDESSQAFRFYILTAGGVLLEITFLAFEGGIDRVVLYLLVD